MYTVHSSVRESELWVYRYTYYGYQIRLGVYDWLSTFRDDCKMTHVIVRQFKTLILFS